MQGRPVSFMEYPYHVAGMSGALDMAKCEHGVYIPAWTRGSKAPYCGMCNPAGVDSKREVVLPARGAMNIEGQANKRRDGACPGEILHCRAAERVP